MIEIPTLPLYIIYFHHDKIHCLILNKFFGKGGNSHPVCMFILDLDRHINNFLLLQGNTDNNILLILLTDHTVLTIVMIG